MDLLLKDKVIIVTGGASGIGGGISRVLASEGAVVVIVGRDEVENITIVREITSLGGSAYAVVAELTRPEDCAAAVAQVFSRFGRIDGLVNNAGLNDGVGLENGSYEGFVLSMQRNVVHYYLMARHALPALKAARGVIVNITSKTAETGQGGTSGYAAANGERNELTRSWAEELLGFGVRVNAVVVAECWTPQYEKWVGGLPDASVKLAEIVNSIPLEQRMTTIEEIADTVAFLLSPRSLGTNGQLIHVDGGYVHLDRAVNRK